MRVDRFLAEMGLGTRKEVRGIIKEKRVAVNGETVKDPAGHVDEEKDRVTVDGNEIVYHRFVYYMMNKPAGYISASLTYNEPGVMELVDEPYRGLFPAGRLDKDVEGLLFITNDGALAHRLLSPKNGIEKEYAVQLAHTLCEADIERASKGLSYGEEDYAPARIEQVRGNFCHIIVTEGKFHEVKNIFLALDNEVTYLKRVRFHTLLLDESLESGSYRALTKQEIKALKEV